MDGFTILAGTVGNGLWRSGDGGASFAVTPGITPLDAKLDEPDVAT